MLNELIFGSIEQLQIIDSVPQLPKQKSFKGNMDISTERAYPTPFANSPLLPLLILSLAKQRHTPKPSTTFDYEYDYVVVGGGSAGSVVASRLSEKECVTVLLLEAGKSAPVLTEIPSISRNFVNSDIDWQYKTVPQKHTGEFLVNREVPWPGGKGIGGSSLFNAMIFSRGNRKNYDDWTENGAEGWSFKDVWPYFLKLENNTDPEYLRNGYHSSNGPMSIQKPKYEAKIKKHILQAVKESGYRIVDPNGARQTGFYDFQAFLRNSQRCNTAKAYLVPAENRSNLHIIPQALVTKIPVVADLPVGNNFQDHISVPLTYSLNDTFSTTLERIKDPHNIQEYIHNRTGPLSSAQFTSVLGFVKGESVDPEEDFPSAQLYFAELTTELPKTQIGLKPEIYEEVFQPYENKPIFNCGTHFLQPKSRGTIRLQSASPFDPPLIDPNYFEDPKDVEETVKAMKVCHKLSTSEPMKKVGSKLISTTIPGCADFKDDEDRFYECMARGLVVTMSHPVGTTKMGNPSDPTTVVDPQLKVKGIEGLRVADASVMPSIPSANMNVPTIMIAEKASDIIKQTVRCRKHEDENSIYSAFFEH
ncbi:unnamed protein product [Larinioides sclopetarius]|uniref:Glucose dehydrogenase [FAD, quinone] n=1 Tax=Larinioides sclopetarius TaxID=280406 RepID=A0AAV2BQ67_9ARAC